MYFVRHHNFELKHHASKQKVLNSNPDAEISNFHSKRNLINGNIEFFSILKVFIILFMTDIHIFLEFNFLSFLRTVYIY